MPYSTFSKIHDILLSLQSQEQPIPINDLAETVQNDESKESFNVWIRSGSETRQTRVQIASIRRVIRFTAALNLLEIRDGRLCLLTKIGENALDGGNYPVQLASQLKRYMKDRFGIDFSQLEDAIESIKSPAVPTRATVIGVIRERYNVSVDEAGFRSLLYLFERCNEIDAKMAKLYSTRGMR